ncbi:long-chain-fatty-acid--CoA ligase [Nocardia puris]|uniref:Fatty-acyl-CoA synthase n=1 Tax=Nocardia puris TaxID=208602 RepID=A0A366DNC5_9NOCA|nr:fatty-acid--CoA ligase FadD5 [Nocardia puris]MBF6213585.1 long-chain-fatty-acid--CoA ligase [Nocardia puris]MBF6365485.1 long-chain-fatty-acid--CoA ligase [Nocardia puris]MBF6459951.1 long-chain-fatty-acid--CoA ligase [Nocardia puris]RBO91566.1 fatty-acyl-CoA synthase [Nocardia puris]
MTTGAQALDEPIRSRRNHWNNQIATHALMRPDAVALRFRGADTTWRQLHERSQRFADALARRGVGFGDRVLILALNHPEYLEAVFGINALGAIAVPVNFRLTPPEIAYIAADSGATTLVTDAPLQPLAAAVRAQSPALATCVVIGGQSAEDVVAYEDALAEDGAPHTPLDIPEDTPALIMYTSGTTGSPKGAVLSYANMNAQALTCIRAMDIGPDSIGFCTSPLFHIAGLGSLAPYFQLGGKTVLHPLGAFDATEFLDAVEAERATTAFCVPAQWQLICAEPTVKQRDLALRMLSWGAAPASDTVLRAMADCFPDAQNVAVFGQTEMSPITCVLEGKDALRKLGSVGKVVPTIQARVVDDGMNDVAPGEIGEIVYRGPTLMQGYWNKPEATAESFAGGWFHSGDLVRQDEEGFVWVVDRKKDMIISGGENIYCAEVENVLFAHPKIREAAVIGRAHEKWGEVPVAVVALADPEGDLTLAELEPYLNESLARYKHPKDLVLVPELPRNASGKVVKVQLRKDHGS